MRSSECSCVGSPLFRGTEYEFDAGEIIQLQSKPRNATNRESDTIRIHYPGNRFEYWIEMCLFHKKTADRIEKSCNLAQI